MKSFYEKRRDDAGSLAIQRNAKNAYPAHFHNNLEICLIRNGGYEIGVNGQRYRAENGSVVVIDSFDIHCYEDLPFQGKKDTCVLIVPYRYLDRFNAKKQGMRIKEPLLVDSALCDTLLRLVDEYLLPGKSESVRQSVVELILALLAERLVLAPNRGGDERVLMRDILIYIQNNFRGAVTRADIAHALGYTEAHISRVFHRYLGISISEYVNGLRLDHIDRLLAEGNHQSVNSLIFDAGFGSQQTYYRARKRARK